MKTFTQIHAAILCLLLFLSVAWAQKPETKPDPDEDIVDGCLYSGGESNFNLVDEQRSYILKGHEAELKKHAGEEIKVVGTIRGDRDQNPTFIVRRVERVFKPPLPKLAASVANPSNWHEHVNREYGIRYWLPEFPADTAAGGLWPNFVADDGTTTFASLNIPRDIYPDTNFVGGSVIFSVNPKITNRESCEKFGVSDARFVSSVTIGDISYSKSNEGDVALGTYYEGYSFHTFQNGYCYEFGFQFGGYNTGNQDLGCRVPIVGDYQPVIDAFMKRVTYVRPAKINPSSNESGSPRITSFTASSDTADSVENRGSITFTWSSQGADYVQFSYRCSEIGQGIVILEDGGSGRNCANDPKPISPNPEVASHAPNSSVNIGFGNHHRTQNISITVTVTPFSHGKAFPDGQKSLTVEVTPFHR